LVVACIGGIVAIVATAVWLGSRSDATLARWSAIASVISVVVAVLALVAAVVPLWRHDDDGGQPAREPGTVVTQKIKSGRGRVNVAGRDQFNIDINRRPGDKR
jgi:membrane protein implicated in regulation of membrane protease activity